MENRHQGGKGMRMIVAVCLGGLVALSSTCAWRTQAKKRSGANIVVQRAEGVKIKGELVGVRSDGLVLETKEGAATIPITEIESLWTVKKMSSRSQRASIGMGGLIGGIGGFVAAKMSHIKPSDMGDSIALGELFLVGGMVVGAGVAALVVIVTRTSKGDVYDFKNKSEEKIEAMLTDLRKQARVPDYR